VTPPPASATTLLLLFLTACATHHVPVPATLDSGLDPTADTFAYANELYWDYDTAVSRATRAASSGARGGDAELFGQRCALMARAVRQFFYGARFDPDLPRLPDEGYRPLVKRVLATDPRRETPLEEPVVFPGFANLQEFSAHHEEILKEKTGGRWRSYLQRGNWRMITPFSPRQQQRTTESLLQSLADGHPPIVHVINFPDITVNHTLLLHRAEATASEVRFFSYDPNRPRRDVMVRYDREQATFFMQPTAYFAGGSVKVYEIYDGWLY
jgi:hypothetical protein